MTEIDPRLEGWPQSTIDAYIWLKKYSGKSDEYIANWVVSHEQLQATADDAEELGPRSNVILHDVDVYEWTQDEVFEHLQKTYLQACEAYPDIMEKFLIVSIDIDDERKALKEFWRMALRETIQQRYSKRRPAQYGT